MAPFGLPNLLVGVQYTRDCTQATHERTIQGIINDLILAKNTEYTEYIADRKAWSNTLFDNLTP